MSRRFRLVEHTADLAIRISASTMPELFICAAEAMFAQLARPATALPQSMLPVSVDGTDYESLLVNWLNELLFLHETNRQTYTEFLISDLSPQRLEATVKGAPLAEARMLIKAATYHGLSIKATSSGYSATVLFDV